MSRALTALALFEILRFPLFMLPNVVNNLVEAGVTVSRLKSFLVSEEREPVSSGTLTAPGVALEQVTCAWDNPSLRKSVLSPAEAEGSAPDVTSKGKGKKGAVGKTYSALEDKEWQVALLQVCGRALVCVCACALCAILNPNQMRLACLCGSAVPHLLLTLVPVQCYCCAPAFCRKAPIGVEHALSCLTVQLTSIEHSAALL